jgi:hypothetical protein
MIRLIKNNFSYFYKFSKFIFLFFRNNKRIKNYYNTDYNRFALLSYITLPFKKDSLEHTNFFEAQSWGKILSELGYNVDIIHYENNQDLDLSKYDLICGFGNIFNKYFESGSKKKIITINYATGLPICFQNQSTLQRVRDVYQKKGVYLGKSARYIEKNWGHSTTLVDGIITLGNGLSINQFRKYYDGNIEAIPAPFYLTKDPYKIISQRKNNSNKHFLWFGSSGLIHKGLDLLLDYFVNHQELTLHICGPINNEEDFVNTYYKELYRTKNIHTHGFIDIGSKKYEEILQSCDFSILPSCSEGGAPSILTSVGNGGLIPIITRECTISTGYEILIDELNDNGIKKAIDAALSLSKKKIRELQEKNIQYVHSAHSKEQYYDLLKTAITKITLYKND